MTASPSVEDHVLLEGHVGGNLTGLISVGEIYRLDIDGQVQSGIQANTSGLGPFWLYAGSVGANGAALWLSDPQDFNGSGQADAADLQILTDALGTPVDE